MFKKFFSKDINIPTLRLSGVIGQAGIARSGLTITGIEKLIDKLFEWIQNKNLKIISRIILLVVFGILAQLGIIPKLIG